MRKPYFVIRAGYFLRLDGPFAYPRWMAQVADATPLLKCHAAAWAEVYRGRFVPVTAFMATDEDDVHVNKAPITERVPATKPEGSAGPRGIF
jgi:hypothetical protein